MEFDKYIACMYEGEAERAILDILLDNKKLIFSRTDLLEEEPIPRCKPKEFDKFENQRKRENKPSSFCKEVLNYPEVKSYSFVKEYFSDCSKLLYAIKEYKRVSKIRRNEYSLYDLINW